MNRRGIDWAPRIAAAIATVAIGEAHLLIFGNPVNTRAGISVYLATSALFNAASIFCYAHLLTNKLSSDLQKLAYCAIILNGLAWITYMLELSPRVVNDMVQALTYGTFTRLLWISDGDSDVGGWRDLLRRAADWCMGIHFRTTKP
jgi:hypothetical protein